MILDFERDSQQSIFEPIENDVKRALGLPVREEPADAVPAEQKKAVAASTEKK